MTDSIVALFRIGDLDIIMEIANKKENDDAIRHALSTFEQCEYVYYNSTGRLEKLALCRSGELMRRRRKRPCALQDEREYEYV